MAAMKTPAPHYPTVSYPLHKFVFDGCAYALLGALAAETLDLAVTVDLVVLKDSELGTVAMSDVRFL